MFGFGGEMLFIFFLAMLIFGPEKLPEIGRMLAKGMAEVRKASNELQRTLSAELAVTEQDKEAARLREASFPPPPPPAPPAWSGETVPTFDAPGASAAPAGSGEGAAGSSEVAASDEGAAGSRIAESSEAALSSDAAYYAAWPEDGTSPASAANSGAPAAAAEPATPAAPATHPDSTARTVPRDSAAPAASAPALAPALVERSSAGDRRDST
jgi:Sec-independent protein translocase protein TatA